MNGTLWKAVILHYYGSVWAEPNRHHKTTGIDKVYMSFQKIEAILGIHVKFPGVLFAQCVDFRWFVESVGPDGFMASSQDICSSDQLTLAI